MVIFHRFLYVYQAGYWWPMATNTPGWNTETPRCRIQQPPAEIGIHREGHHTWPNPAEPWRGSGFFPNDFIEGGNDGKRMGKMMGKWWEKDGKNDGKMMGKWWENDGKRMGKGWENDGKMMGRGWENDGKMMGKGWENDGNMIGKWWEEDGKMMGKWWENHQPELEFVQEWEVLPANMWAFSWGKRW